MRERLWRCKTELDLDMTVGFHKGNTSSVFDEWLITLFGLFTAIATACLLVHWPQLDKRSWGAFMLTSTGYVSCAAIAGGVGAWFLISLGKPKNPLEFSVIAACAAVGWVWVPATVMLLRQGSLWALAIVTAAAMAMAACVRASGTLSQDRAANRLWHPWIISIGFHGAMAAIVVHSLVIASILLAISGFALMLHLKLKGLYSTPDKSPAHAFLRLAWVTVLAIVITSIALLPGIAGRSASQLSIFFGLRQSSGGSPAGERQSPGSANGTSYQSVILWTVRKEKKSIVPFTRPVTSLPIPKSSIPMVIPFSGSYWYFKKPDKSPGRDTHFAQGSPLSVDIHSADRRALVMEAHQDIAPAIDLACCNEIEVDLKNGDDSHGTILIGLILKDSASPGKPSEYLGLLAIASREPNGSSPTFPVTDDVLKFPIPAHLRIRKFDEITVAILPPDAWVTEGSKIAIRQFVLSPH